MQEFNNKILFLIILTANLLLVFTFQNKIATADVVYSSFRSNVSVEDINQILSFQEKYGWLSYVFQVIVLLIKIFFTSTCIYIGLLLNYKKIQFNRILRTVLLAEFVFVIYTVFRLGFIYTKDFSTLEQIQNFWPLSLFSIFSSDSIPQWLFYPLYTINIAEIAYWLVLALGLTYLMKTKFLQSLKTVLTSYGAGLLLWMVFLVFVQLYFLDSV